jgi:hypothetical protein
MKKIINGRGLFARSTLIAIRVIAALSLTSPAMAHGGGGGGHGGGGYSGGAGHGGGFGGGGWHGGGGGWHGGGAGPAIMNHAGASISGGRIHGWSGKVSNRADATWGRGHDRGHDHEHGRFHHHRFFARGFDGPDFDYGYDSCWAYNGWRWIYVCTGYPD